jgi:hypothetical protein
MEVDYSLNARIQRDCFRILTLGKPKSYGRTIKLECTRFEFINEFLPGVYAEMDVPDPFTGKKYRRIVPRKLVRELSGLPPKPKYEPIEEQTKVNSILEKIEIRMQRETQALTKDEAMRAQARLDLAEILIHDGEFGEYDAECISKTLVNRAKEIIELVALAAGIELEKVDV